MLPEFLGEPEGAILLFWDDILLPDEEKLEFWDDLLDDPEGVFKADSIDDLFEELASVFPYPIEEEFDWDSIELGEKKELIVYREEYV